MPIARVGQFFEAADLGITASLGIESAQLSECIAEINRRQIRGVFGSPAFGFAERELAWLIPLREIRQVWLWDVHLSDIEGLYSQPTLTYLGILPKRPAIDFSRFGALSDLVWQPVAHDRGIEQLTQLERLDVWRYKSKDSSFAAIQLPETLRKLEFNWCNPARLDGLPCLPGLEELQFHHCRNLTTLDGLARVAPTLKKLVNTGCASLASFSEALDMKLAQLYINVRGKVVARHTAGHGPSASTGHTSA